METLSLSNYNTYSNYKKCGEILKSPIIGEKQYALLCLQCHEICLQFQTFMIHIEQEHENTFLDIKTKKEADYRDSDEDDIVLSEYVKTDNEENEDKKYFLMDPLEEPEVLLVENAAQKDQIKSRQTRQSLNDSKRRSQTKKLQEKVVKQEPDDNDTKSCQDGLTTEIEFLNPTVQSDEDDLDIADLEDKKDKHFKLTKDDDNDGNYSDDYVRDDNEDDNDYDDDDVDEDAETLDEIKTPPAKKSKVKMDDGLDIDEFMKNKMKVILFIKSYQKQDELWDATRPPKLVNRCRKKREECLKIICDELEKLQIQMTMKDVEKCIKYMRVRYIREVRIRMNYIKNKDKDYKPLWFYNHLEFLKPTLSFIQELEEEQLLAKPEMKDEQIITLIDIYKTHPCLWDEQDIYYNSDQRRQETLQSILTEVNEKLQLNCTLTEVEDKIEFIHKLVKKEKENIIDYAANKPVDDYKSSCKFYEHIEFLFTHLGPFKCQFCPKILTHIYTFRIHTAKHDGSKPFKCSVCQYEFTQKPGYVIHLRRHTQDFPFVCKYCGKGFPCKKELKLHFQNHPEYEKEFICDICGEGFTQQKLLNWHLKAHNNIRDSICKICGKGFTNSKLLFQHRTVHSQLKSVCKLCGKTYAHYRGLSRHMTKDHGTTVAAVAAVMGEKPKKRVLTLNEIN